MILVRTSSGSSRSSILAPRHATVVYVIMTLLDLLIMYQYQY